MEDTYTYEEALEKGIQLALQGEDATEALHRALEWQYSLVPTVLPDGTVRWTEERRKP